MCVGCARSNKISLDNLLYQSAVKRMRPLSIPKSTPALNWSLRSHLGKEQQGGLLYKRWSHHYFLLELRLE